MTTATEQRAFTHRLEEAEDELDISSWMREYFAFHKNCNPEISANGHLRTAPVKR
jgi:hypothetical protein